MLSPAPWFRLLSEKLKVLLLKTAPKASIMVDLPPLLGPTRIVRPLPTVPVGFANRSSSGLEKPLRPLIVNDFTDISSFESVSIYLELHSCGHIRAPFPFWHMDFPLPSFSGGLPPRPQKQRGSEAQEGQFAGRCDLQGRVGMALGGELLDSMRLWPSISMSLRHRHVTADVHRWGRDDGFYSTPMASQIRAMISDIVASSGKVSSFAISSTPATMASA